MKIETIKTNLASEYTDKELVEIFISNDSTRWSEESIKAAGELIYSKFGKVPDQSLQIEPHTSNYSLFSSDLVERLNGLESSKQCYSDRARSTQKVIRILSWLLIWAVIIDIKNYVQNNIIDFNITISISGILAILLVLSICFYHINKSNLLGDKLIDIIKCLENNKIIDALKVCSEVVKRKPNDKFTIKESFVRAYAIFVKTCYQQPKNNELMDEAIEIFEKISGWHPDSSINYTALAILCYQRDYFSRAIDNIEQCRRLGSCDYLLAFIYSVSTFMAQVPTEVKSLEPQSKVVWA